MPEILTERTPQNSTQVVAAAILRAMKPLLADYPLQDLSLGAMTCTPVNHQHIYVVPVRKADALIHVEAVADALVKRIKQDGNSAVRGSIGIAGAGQSYYCSVYDPIVHCGLSVVDEGEKFTVGIFAVSA